MRLKLQKIEETVYIVGGNIKCATDDKKKTSVTKVIMHVLLVISLDSGLNSNWLYPHLRTNLLKTLEPFMVCNTLSTVGIG